MKLTYLETKLNELINSVQLSQYSPERDTLIIDVLMYVSTISQNGDLKKLLKVIKIKFPEYGH